MANPTIYFRDDMLAWLDEYRGEKSRASVVRKALEYYRREKTNWEAPHTDTDGSRCDYCGAEFQNSHGADVHQGSCEKRKSEGERVSA